MKTKEQKIRAILDGKANELFSTEQVAGDVDASGYADYWKDITLDEVKEVAKRDGISEKLFFTKEGNEDGLYLLSKDGKWTLYLQERAIKFVPQVFDTKDEAISAVVGMVASSFLSA